MKQNEHLRKIVIGRTEPIGFVDEELMDIPARVDTGAYRSAVHAEDIVEKDGILSFKLLKNHPSVGGRTVQMTSSEYNTVQIENSFGHKEKRYEVKMRVRLGPRIVKTGFTLANRGKKLYPVLVGRKLLNTRYLVDTTISGLDRKMLKKKYNIELLPDEEEQEQL